ncbi:hypothetical protein GH722_04740 [Alphaproteobacteria bacterium HT1-32]|nr:hypothetical protein [Alphaproteobacteria bacterium HT1-32]
MGNIVDGLTFATVVLVVIAVVRVAFIVMQRRDPDAENTTLLRDRQSRMEEAWMHRNKVLKDRAVWKMIRTIELCRENLNPALLAPGQDRYIQYYLGYLLGFAEAVSLADGVEFDRILRLPIYLEASKLLGDGHGDVQEGAEMLVKLSGSEFFELGRSEGVPDGTNAAQDSGERYFHRIDLFFSQPG